MYHKFVGTVFVLLMLSGIVSWILLMFVFDEDEKPKPTKPAAPTTLSVPANMKGDAEAIALVKNNWHRLVRHCPGLTRYQKDLTYQELRDYSDPMFEEMARVEVVYRVADDMKMIPTYTNARGHACGFGITPDEISLIIQKQACVEVCLGEPYTGKLSYYRFL